MDKMQILPAGISWNQNTHQAKKEEKINAKKKKKKKNEFSCKFRHSRSPFGLCDRCPVMPAEMEFFGRIIPQIA